MPYLLLSVSCDCSSSCVFYFPSLRIYYVLHYVSFPYFYGIKFGILLDVNLRTVGLLVRQLFVKWAIILCLQDLIRGEKTSL